MVKPKIGLPLFADYANGQGQDRMKIVRQQRQRIEGAEPAYCFYAPAARRLRLAVASTSPADQLDRMVEEASNMQRRHFSELRDGMHAFVGASRPSLVPVRSGCVWSTPDLDVLVRQHIGLLVRGQRFATLLYLKEPALTQSAADGALRIIEVQMDQLLPDGEPAVLDVRRGKLWHLHKRKNRVNLDGWLRGEAAGYAAHWAAAA